LRVLTDFPGVLRDIELDGLLTMFKREVADLCGPTYHPTVRNYRRADTEMVNLDTTAGLEWLSKSRVMGIK